MTDFPQNQELDEHLSRISTVWTVLFQAHGSSGQVAGAAKAKLLQRYGGAVYRYLFSVLRDSHAADELAQEFALTFLRGGFKGAKPDKGRFRDYVKASLFNLIRQHHKQLKRHSPNVKLSNVEPAKEESFQNDQAFLQGWRDELLARTWDSLAEYENQTGKLVYTLLLYRAKNPDTSSARMAEVLGPKLRKEFTAAGIRQTIHRAREKFGDLLIEETARSLETEDTEIIRQELIDLNLVSFCTDALQRWVERQAKQSG